MNLNTLNIKIILALSYLIIITICLYSLFSVIDIKDLMSYEFIKSNKDIILKYKNENFLLLGIVFFAFSMLWTLMLGFAMPLLLFSGFVFGKLWGIIIVLTSTTIGATLLYLLANLFFKDFIEKRFASKFSKLKIFFKKNELTYFMFFRFIGGGGTPYPIQNVLPVLFNMSLKNYILATFLGSAPSMFVTVSIGNGIESVIDQNAKINVFNFLFSSEIYIPIIGFFILLMLSNIIKKIYFKD